MIELFDIPKKIFSKRSDLSILKNQSVIIETIRNYINIDNLESFNTTDIGFGVRDTLLKAETHPIKKYLVNRIKKNLERDISQVKTAKVTIRDSGGIRNLLLDVELQDVGDIDSEPINIVFRI